MAMLVTLLLHDDDDPGLSQFSNLIDAPVAIGLNIRRLYDEFLSTAEHDPEATEAVESEETADDFARWLCEHHGCKILTEPEHEVVYLQPFCRWRASGIGNQPS
jgi:hypothetical protein